MTLSELKKIVDELVADGQGDAIASLYPESLDMSPDFSRAGGDWTIVSAADPGGEDDYVTLLFGWQPA